MVWVVGSDLDALGSALLPHRISWAEASTASLLIKRHDVGTVWVMGHGLMIDITLGGSLRTQAVADLSSHRLFITPRRQHGISEVAKLRQTGAKMVLHNIHDHQN